MPRGPHQWLLRRLVVLSSAPGVGVVEAITTFAVSLAPSPGVSHGDA